MKNDEKNLGADAAVVDSARFAESDRDGKHPYAAGISAVCDGVERIVYSMWVRGLMSNPAQTTLNAFTKEMRVLAVELHQRQAQAEMFDPATGNLRPEWRRTANGYEKVSTEPLPSIGDSWERWAWLSSDGYVEIAASGMSKEDAADLLADSERLIRVRIVTVTPVGSHGNPASMEPASSAQSEAP